MVSAPYLLRLHPTFSVPRLSLFLADRRCSCAPQTAVSLARTATCSACRRLGRSLVLRPQPRPEWGARAGTWFAGGDSFCAGLFHSRPRRRVSVVDCRDRVDELEAVHA